jgi:hypothetical protein
MEANPTTFQIYWAISGAVLVVCAALIGRAVKKGLTGILIDDRGRYSLNRFQLVMWTLLVMSTFLGLFFSSGYTAANLKIVFGIPQTLLVLMGISVGSATTAGAVKSGKDQNPQVRVAKAGLLPPHPAAVAAAAAAGAAPPQPQVVPPKFSQVFLEEEGSQVDKVVDVTKFQNFFFTLALGIAYVVTVANMTQPNYPQFDPNVMWLLGISHAGYVAGKLPTKG